MPKLPALTACRCIISQEKLYCCSSNRATSHQAEAMSALPSTMVLSTLSFSEVADGAELDYVPEITTGVISESTIKGKVVCNASGMATTVPAEVMHYPSSIMMLPLDTFKVSDDAELGTNMEVVLSENTMNIANEGGWNCSMSPTIDFIHPASSISTIKPEFPGLSSQASSMIASIAGPTTVKVTLLNQTMEILDNIKHKKANFGRQRVSKKNLVKTEHECLKAMARIRELYKGHCLDDLEVYYQLPNLKNSKLATLLSTAQKVYRKAEECYIDGDEELSYIYFMRYFNLIDHIRKMPDYASNKQQVAKSLGHHKQLKEVMDKTEALSNSLKSRYSQLPNNPKAPATVDNSFREIGIIQDSDQNMAVSAEELKGVTAMELFNIMRDPKMSLLLMDCRPKIDFASSRLNYQSCINVPSEIILPGMTAGRIQQQLEANSKALWSARMVKDSIVLMDWSTKSAEPILHTSIWRLRDILLNWDPDVTYRSPIKVLIGGYENFILMYPMQCTNPSVQAPLTQSPDNSVLDDIEYPSINDITMKDPNKFDSPSNQAAGDDATRPAIDRKSKAAALKTYDEKQKVFELLQQQESLMEKVLDNERKRLKAENDWKNVSDQVKETEGTEQKNVLMSREQELLYSIMQLESKERDYKLENERLLQQVEEYKRREREMCETLSVIEAENLKRTEESIEVKVKEARQIDEQREKITQEREKQLAFAREQKRHLKPPSEEDTSKAKIPQFDRSIKPPSKPVIEEIDVPIRRDFSGVPGTLGRGLTGLKNLGNTCYMNSVMQCLSNTTALVEYFVTHSYRKHINRLNKTQGRIVEEVAALIKVLWNGQYKYISSKDLRYIVGQYQQIFRGIEQQDSHEFLTILMDWLHSDLQTLQIADSPRTNLSASQKAWIEFTKSRESLILRLFYGQIKSTVKCMDCSKESATYECFSNLSLELPQNANRCELTDCFDMYFNGERIRGWNCPSCKEKRDAIKKLDISKLPPILVVHFKRFYADSDGNTYKKKQSFVNFPLANLNLNSYIARTELRSGGNKIYHLYAVSNHYGSMEGGHYTAFCKSSIYGKWFKFDDQSVSSIDSSDVDSSAAYILFYSCLPEAPHSDII